MKIYWANSFFGKADFLYNSTCVETLRKKGYEIFLPQEQDFNQVDIPTNASEIFKSDTNEILKSDVLVACIDQESIDSGVACEIGIAWATNKIIVALYTDLRQDKKFEDQEGTMYKNLYVLGCIRDKGIIVKSVEQIDEYLKSKKAPFKV